MSPLDELGMAITNAGYTWTPEMRKAYERGVREQKKKREWVGLTDEEREQLILGNVENVTVAEAAMFKTVLALQEAKLKEKNNV